MNLEQWKALTQEEQNLLAAKYGLTRSGLNNDLASEAELEKIIIKVKPVIVEPVIEEVKKVKKVTKLGNVKKKTPKLGTKKLPKLGNRGRSIRKSKSR